MTENFRQRFALEHGIVTFDTGYLVYGFLTSVVVMNGLEDGICTTGVNFLEGFSAEQPRQHFAFEHGIGNIYTGFFINGFLTIVVIMNDVEDSVDTIDVNFIHRFAGITVCCVFK